MLPMANQAIQSRDNAKREIARTLKAVVDVMTKQTGGLLNNESRQAIRSVILKFPNRWVNPRQKKKGLLLYGSIKKAEN